MECAFCFYYERQVINLATRRMFSSKITDCDDFTSLPPTAQLLYFHLGLAADDDGFVNRARQIRLAIGASEGDLELLITKGYILRFEDSVYAITHWLTHNAIRWDRYTPTIYRGYRNTLDVRNNVYVVRDEPSTWQPDGNPREDSADKDNILSIASTDSPTCPDAISNTCEQAVQLLNNLSGSSYRPSSKQTQRFIIARVREGYTLDDFEAVIRHQCSLWINDATMQQYLRPQTLFGSKFECYLSNARKTTTTHELGYELAPLDDPYDTAVVTDC